ncbi:MAG: M14 family zinc carboxypeptidase, partial [Chloroflexia bacterium]
MQSKLRTSLAAMLATGLLLLACQVALLDAAPLAGAQLRPANSEVIEPGTFYGGYYTVEEIQGFLDQEVAAHPGLAEKVDFGDSWCKAHVGACTLPELYNGYDMWAIRITNQSIAGPKPVFWVDGGIHAREIATPEVAMSYIRWLLDNYDTNADAHWLVDYHDIWVAPMINPDGHHIVEAGGSGSNPYFQRKNANNAEGCTTWPPSTDQFGVDLNRNFPFMWNCCGGSTGEPCDPNYRGASPASEDETRAVVAKIRELIPDQRGPNLEDLAPITTTGIYQDLHSHGRVVIYPWAHTGTATPNEADIANISKHMIALDAGGNGYPLCDHCASIIDGSAMDWAYGELGVPSYATELSGDSFYPPYPRVQEIWNENRGALVYMAKIARTPYLLAKGPDANGLGATPITVTQGASVELTATINYNWEANAYLQNVTAAEYYVDAPPWMGGTPGPMEP